MSSRDSLDGALEELYSRAFNSGSGRILDNADELIANAKQAIHQWALEEVIGDDKPRPYRQTSEYGDAQNDLRAEQRAKLKGDIDAHNS